jgi:hypothetical protein
VLLAGAHGVTVNAAGSDLGAASAFNRFVNADDDGSIIRDKGAQQEQQHDLAEGAAGPGGTVEDPVIGLEVGLVGETDGAQGGGDGARTRGQERAGEQGLGMLPGRFAEERAEGVQDLYNGTWQVQHLSSFLETTGLRGLPCQFRAFLQMDKV